MPFGAAITFIFYKHFDLYLLHPDNLPLNPTSKTCITRSDNEDRQKKVHEKKQCITVVYLCEHYLCCDVRKHFMHMHSCRF